MRGKQEIADFFGELSGITPAGAGKTSLIKRPCESSWDHPRRCGENLWDGIHRLKPPGSPPQVRGKRECWALTITHFRITPAGAGKTVFGTDRRTAAEDPPRRCGENRVVMRAYILHLGSPPQVRGKREVRTTPRVTLRITPAGAGKTKPP